MLKNLKNKFRKVIEVFAKISVFIFFIGLGVYSAQSFTEPVNGPGVFAPGESASTSPLTVLLGATNSVTSGTDTIFNFLRTIYTNIGGTPSSQTGYTTDKGRISDLIGTSTPDTADGKNVFNYLKLINDNLDFPSTANVLNSDTVKTVAGDISSCSSNGTNACYAATGKWASADCTNGNNACYANSGKWASADCTNGTNACYANSGYWASALCASAGSQSCWPTGTYYAAIQQSVSNLSVSQSAGYYPAFNLATVDTDLATANIKSGITIYGVAGDSNVVDTSAGTVNAAGLVSSGYICYSDGTQYSGSLANCASQGSQSCYATGTYYSATACSGTTGQQTCYAGASGEWHDDECADSTTATKTECFVDDTAKYVTATACSAASANGSCFVNTSTMAGTDADLVAGNIKSGVTIFGVAGSY